MNITIKGIELQGEITDLYIEGEKIGKIGKDLPVLGEKIDGKGKTAIPGFINSHTHAAMTLFRGFGDDMPLEAWLKEKIWPYEQKLTNEYVYWATKLACLEMIKSGTTTFNDMYYFFDGVSKAVEEMGLRAFISTVVFDRFDPALAEQSKKQAEEIYRRSKDCSNRIQVVVGPHALYTVSGESLQWCFEFAKKHDLFMHTHLAETQTECNFSKEQFGLSPVQYFHKLGILDKQLLAAHCIWIDDEDLALLAEHQVRIIHNPNSNLKLASGYQFRYEEMKKAGLVIGLGTDGCSSSNNLDMVEAIKTASLIQKAWRFDPTSLPASEAFDMATLNGGVLLNKPIGCIEEGALADICLVNTHSPAFTPNHCFMSNLIYASNGSCVDTVICNGKVLMKDRYVEGEEEILFQVNKITKALFTL